MSSSLFILPATMLVTAIGLGISLVLGLALAVVMDESDLVRKMIYPIVVVSQTIPTTAIAPLFVLWFGYGIWSKVLVTVLHTFFPPHHHSVRRAPLRQDGDGGAAGDLRCHEEGHLFEDQGALRPAILLLRRQDGRCP